MKETPHSFNDSGDISVEVGCSVARERVSRLSAEPEGVCDAAIGRNRKSRGGHTVGNEAACRLKPIHVRPDDT